MPAKRAAAGTAPAQGEGLRALKRLDAGADKAAGGEADARAAKLLLDAWTKRQSAPRLLFRASRVVCCLLCSRNREPFSPCDHFARAHTRNSPPPHPPCLLLCVRVIVYVCVRAFVVVV